MTYPSHLGGSASPGLSASTSLVRAVVRGSYKDESSNKWFLQVRLRGGKILNRVRVLSATDSATGGDRTPMPGVGATGLLGFEESEHGIDYYWMGCIDVAPHGVDQDKPGERITMFPSGYSESVTEDGTHTTRWPNGDVMFSGSGAPYIFKLRSPSFKEDRKLYDLKDLPVRNHYVLDASKGGALWAVLLFGGISMKLDAVKRVFELRLSDNALMRFHDAGLQVKAAIMQVGNEPDTTVPVALWPETETTLVALAHELRSVKRKLILTEARVNRNQLVLEALLTAFFPYFLPLLRIPPIPLPFFTKSDKSGGLIPNVGGVQIVDAASTSIYGE